MVLVAPRSAKLVESHGARFTLLCGYASLLLAFATMLLLWDPAGELVRARFERDARRQQLTAIVDNTLNPNGAAQWLQDRARSGESFRYFGYDQALLMNRGAIRTYHVSHDRPTAWAILVNNRGIQFQLDDIQGYNPVQQSIYVELMDSINGIEQSYHAANVLASGLNSPLLNQLNVRYIVVPRNIPPGRPDLYHLIQQYPTVYVDSNSRILENPGALPRAWIVHRADQEDEDEDILTKFSLKLADPSQVVLLTGEPPELERSSDPSAESVEITKYEADEIHLRVTANATGMVVLSEIWDTTVASRVAPGNDHELRLLERAAAGDPVAITAPTVMEISQGLAKAGPVNPSTQFPDWYRDKSGVTLEPCLEPKNPMCIIGDVPNPDAPVQLDANDPSRNNFPDEMFYFLADSNIGAVGSAGAVGKARLTLAVEGTASDATDPQVFARVRIRVTDGLVGNRDYKVIHPYGTTVVHTDADEPKIFVTEDVGLGVGNFNGVLCGRATWKDGIPVYAKEGAAAFERWLEDRGVKNIEMLNEVLRRSAKPWWDVYGGKQALGL